MVDDKDKLIDSLIREIHKLAHENRQFEATIAQLEAETKACSPGHICRYIEAPISNS